MQEDVQKMNLPKIDKLKFCTGRALNYKINSLMVTLPYSSFRSKMPS